MSSKFTEEPDGALITADVNDEAQQRLGTLDGYETLDLVSLEEATDPLISIVPEIKRMVHQSLEQSATIKSSMPIDERAAIMLYSMEWSPRETSFYRQLNSTLQSSERNQLLSPWLLYLKLFLTALARLSSTFERTVFCGVKNDESEKYVEGSKIVWWGFTSCTSSMNVIEDERFLGTSGNRTLFSIDCDTGKDIHRFAFRPEEKQILLLPGREFKVVRCSKMGHGLTMIRLKEIQARFPSLSVFLPSNPSNNSKYISSVENKIDAKTKHPTKFSYFDQNLIDGDMQRVMNEAAADENCFELDISCNHITDEGAAIISKGLQNCSRLAILCLQYNEIGAYGSQYLADFLSKNKTLTALDLRNNQIEDRGAQYLANALKKNKTLAVLDLGTNKIGDKGAQSLADALRNNETLTTLDLQYNDIGPEGVQRFGDALRFNKTLAVLDLASNQIKDDGAESLANALRSNSALTKLDVRDNQIGDKGTRSLAEALPNNATITVLDLQYNRIGPVGAQFLAEALQNNTTITSLDLRHNQIGDKGTKFLADALRINSTMTTLDLATNQIGDKGALALANALTENATLVTLELGRNRIGDKGAQYLADSLQQNSSLAKLDLRDNQIGDDGAKSLAEALQQNTTLTTLEFARNRIGSVGVQSLVDALRNNTTLTKLDLTSDTIDDENLLKRVNELIQRNKIKRSRSHKNY